MRRSSPRQLSHVGGDGRARMVDVSQKPVTAREAVARGRIRIAAAAMRVVRAARLKKGGVVEVARLAQLVARHDPRADRAERVEALAAIPLAAVEVLEIPAGDVVGDHVAEDVVIGGRRLDVERVDATRGADEARRRDRVVARAAGIVEHGLALAHARLPQPLLQGRSLARECHPPRHEPEPGAREEPWIGHRISDRLLVRRSRSDGSPAPP